MDLSKRVLPVTTSFFWKFCFSLRTPYQELIWCTNKQNVHIHTFCKHWSFIWRCFAPVSVLKTWKQKKEIHSKPRWKSESGCDFYFLLYKSWCFQAIVNICYTAWKVSKYRVFSGLYLRVFELNTERFSVSLRIQSECGKIQTKKTSGFGHFSRSARLSFSKHNWNFCIKRRLKNQTLTVIHK